jgi:hypothetical protein
VNFIFTNRLIDAVTSSAWLPAIVLLDSPIHSAGYAGKFAGPGKPGMAFVINGSEIAFHAPVFS